MSPQHETEMEKVKNMQELISDYLESGGGSEPVRKFLEDAKQNEKLLVRFLRGRKFKEKYAWETIKRYAEVKFDVYPEIFSKECTDNMRSFACNSEIAGVLKNQDKLGRRVELFDGGAWNPDHYSIDDITTAIVKLADATYLERDLAYKGTIYVVQCSGVGAKHIKHLTAHNLRRFIDVFFKGYPVRMKRVFFVNTPFLLTGIINLIKYILPKKLKQRIEVSSGDCVSCKELMELVSIHDMPKSFGGPLEFYEAVQDLMPLLD